MPIIVHPDPADAALVADYLSMTRQSPKPPTQYAITAPLLGVPLTIDSQHPAILAAVETSLARWHDLPPALIDPGPSAHLEVVVRAPGEVALPRGKLVSAQHCTEWLGAGEGMLLRADLAAGRALAFVEASRLTDPERLGHDLIERLGLLLVRQRERIPLRAAAVVGSQRAVVLVANDALLDLTPWLQACQQSGLALLATATVYVGPVLRPILWGQASLDVPEPTLRLVTHATQTVGVLLTPRRGQASRLVPLDPAEATAVLVDTSPGDDPALVRWAAAWLVASGVQQLEAGADYAGGAALIAWLAG